MSESIRIIPWLEGRCSFYAIERNGVCLADEFMEILEGTDRGYSLRLSRMIQGLRTRQQIRPAILRPELPGLGVFALYNHKEFPSEQYNPSRLLCTYVGDSARILLVGSGFIKTRNEPIQMNGRASYEAQYLASVSKKVNDRIECGEIIIVGSKLLPLYPDSFTF